MASNNEIVAAFVASWKSKDIDQLMDFFTDDAVYVNIPIDPPNEGKEMIRKTIEGFSGMASEIEFVVHHQAEGSDGIVMNERTDRFKMPHGWIELPVMGVFELRDCKISAWRDYFDMAQFTQQMGAS